MLAYKRLLNLNTSDLLLTLCVLWATVTVQHGGSVKEDLFSMYI